MKDLTVITKIQNKRVFRKKKHSKIIHGGESIPLVHIKIKYGRLYDTIQMWSF